MFKMNTKILGIGMAALMVLLVFSPLVYAEEAYYDDVWATLDEYDDEMDELNDYIDWAISQDLVDEDFELPAYYQAIFDMIWDEIEENVDFESWAASYNLRSRGGINSLDGAWFYSLWPPGFGFWIDWWLDHQQAQALDDATSYGTAGVAFALIVFIHLFGAPAVVVDVVWLFVSFLINGVADAIGDVDEGNGSHLYWKHYLVPAGLYDDVITLEPQ